MTDIVERLRAIDISWSDEGEVAAEAADVIDALRQQLAEEHEAHLIAEQKWIEELTASQASNKELRNSLELLCSTSNAVEREKYWLVAHKVLAKPLNDTALKAALAAERYRTIKAVMAVVTDAIRELGDK